jgi:cell division protein FtsB
MKPIYVALIIVLAVLQYQLWWGDSSIHELKSLKSNLSMEQARNDAARAHNYKLMKQIKHLKTNRSEVESIARYEHNMIKKGETYFQIVEK